MAPKIALITGGNRGLGRSMALNLAKKGAGIIFTYRTNDREAHEVISEIEKLGVRAMAIQLDTSKTGTFDGFAKQLKTTLKSLWNTENFDFLVNNAGHGARAPFMETTEKDFDELFAVHFKGVFFLTQKLVPMMNDGGSILNVSSGLARFSFPGYSAYASMKGGIETLTRYLAKELGPRKISVNAIAPGAIATDFGGGHVRDNKELNAMIAGQTAMGRVGEAEDIGGAVATILMGDAKWMTGQRLEVSGGMML